MFDIGEMFKIDIVLSVKTHTIKRLIKRDPVPEYISLWSKMGEHLREGRTLWSIISQK